MITASICISCLACLALGVAFIIIAVTDSDNAAACVTGILVGLLLLASSVYGFGGYMGWLTK